ncbi:hypothetical protein DFJ77DRAFT_116705 [Powellomyces hirtus]|nr:hypothetical protein DFJ77DRAFT_116705 [Powellomyces hirtus]
METLAELASGLAYIARPSCSWSYPAPACSAPAPALVSSQASCGRLSHAPLSHHQLYHYASVPLHHPNEEAHHDQEQPHEPTQRLAHGQGQDVQAQHLCYESHAVVPAPGRAPRKRVASVMDMTFLVNENDNDKSNDTDMESDNGKVSEQTQPAADPGRQDTAEQAKETRLSMVDKSKLPPLPPQRQQQHLFASPPPEPWRSAQVAVSQEHRRPMDGPLSISTQLSPVRHNAQVLLTPAASPGCNDEDVPLSACRSRGSVSSSSSSTSPTSATRKRSKITPKQLIVLNTVFAHTFFPSTESRHHIAKETGMTARSVQVWFQNRRQQWRARHGTPAVQKNSHALPHTPRASPEFQTAVGATSCSLGQMCTVRGGHDHHHHRQRVMIKANRGRPRLDSTGPSASAHTSCRGFADSIPAVGAGSCCSSPDPRSSTWMPVTIPKDHPLGPFVSPWFEAPSRLHHEQPEYEYHGNHSRVVTPNVFPFLYTTPPTTPAMPSTAGLGSPPPPYPTHIPRGAQASDALLLRPTTNSGLRHAMQPTFGYYHGQVAAVASYSMDSAPSAQPSTLLVIDPSGHAVAKRLYHHSPHSITA